MADLILMVAGIIMLVLILVVSFAAAIYLILQILDSLGFIDIADIRAARLFRKNLKKL